MTSLWQPISTAPKDGTKILLWNGQYWIGYFDKMWECWDDGDFHDNIENVTHWQPLPDPPTP